MMPASPNPSLFHPRLHQFALFLAGFTPLLLLAGALVTSTGSSLSIPDWPTSDGGLAPPLAKFHGGTVVEYSHRFLAGTVSFLTLGVAICAQLWEKRAWVRKLAWTALGVVVLQAVLGGITVKNNLPTPVSVSHAGLAQIFFCLAVTLALVTSKTWIESTPGGIPDRPSPVQFWALLTTGLVYSQIVLGAVIRHSGFGLAIPDFPLSFGHLFPSDWTLPVALQFSHTRIGAFFVLWLVTHTAYRVCIHYADVKALFWPAAAAAFFVWTQCFLGMLIIATSKAIIPTSVHVLIGAATLASMLILTLNSFRWLKKG